MCVYSTRKGETSRSAAEFISSTELRCSTSSVAKVIPNVLFRLHHGDWISQAVWVNFTVSPMIQDVISLDNLTRIAMIGSHFINQTTLSCLFSGTYKVPAIWLSSTHLACSCPSQVQGNVSVEISDGGVFSSAGRHSQCHASQPTHGTGKSLSGFNVSTFFPSSGPPDVSNLITVRGQGFHKHLTCNFGLRQMKATIASSMLASSA